MEIIKAIVFILLGAAGVLWGADRFTDGSASLAYRLKVSQLVIGLTVVAFGTSAPELFVSLVSALNGTSGMAVGNVIGSNIFNILLIVGVSAAVYPIAIKRHTITRDIPIMVAITLMSLVICLLGNDISRWDGLLLLMAFVAFMLYTLRLARQNKDGEETEEIKAYGSWKSIGLILLGLVCLVVASSIFVKGASHVARLLGVSDVVIGLTIVAGGTSLPELATSIVAARKGQSDMAIGNVVGSCIFNLLLILGFTGVISPINTAGVTTTDYVLFVASALLLWLFAATKSRIDRWEGWLLTLIFLTYMTWIVISI